MSKQFFSKSVSESGSAVADCVKADADSDTNADTERLDCHVIFEAEEVSKGSRRQSSICPIASGS
jgi:hypothetical protein